MKKPDPAQQHRDRDAFQSAVYFTTTILMNQGYQTIRSPSLYDARGHQGRLERFAGDHRKALVYAVTADGCTHLIPDSFEP